jgi:hypothetical protein
MSLFLTLILKTEPWSDDRRYAKRLLWGLLTGFAAMIGVDALAMVPSLGYLLYTVFFSTPWPFVVINGMIMVSISAARGPRDNTRRLFVLVFQLDQYDECSCHNGPCTLAL